MIMGFGTTMNMGMQFQTEKNYVEDSRTFSHNASGMKGNIPE